MTEGRAVAIRVDGGGELGVGHAMRCATLASALRRDGHHVTVVTRRLPDWVRPRFVDAGCRVVDIDPTGDEWRSAVEPVDVWVVDGYTLGPDLQSLLDAHATVAVIDDNHELAVRRAALVVNQNLHASPSLYPDVPRERLRLGSEYALVRTDVLALPARSGPGVGADSVLLAFGGTDPRRLTLPVATALAADGLDVIVAMPGQHPDRAAVASIDGVRFDGGDLLDGLRESDVAVIGGGSTLWEIATVGLPGVAVIVADNQVAGTAAAEAAGFVRAVDVRSGSADAGQVAAAARSLCSDPDVRVAMSAAGRERFDGHGAERVARAVTALG